MDDRGIRKLVYELTPSDLQQFPVWEFALDEEGEEGQDEATVRPLPDQEVAYNGDVARATFVASDGTQFTGYLTPHPERDPGWVQPTIVSDDGQINFWFGWQEHGVTDEMIRPLYKLLGKTPDQLFPISYRVDLPWISGADSSTFDGEVTGFDWRPALGSDEIEERR